MTFVSLSAVTNNFAIVNAIDSMQLMKESRDSYYEDTLHHKVKNLKELIVTGKDKNIVFLRCYIREYTMGTSETDTLRIFAEYISDFYVPLKKEKKFKNLGKMRILNSRIYRHQTRKNGNDTITCYNGCPSSLEIDKISHPYNVIFPYGKRRLSERILHGDSIDFVNGKYGLKETTIQTGDYYTVSLDCLSDEKDHVKSPWQFKMLGCSIDIPKCYHQWIVSPDEYGYYDASDVVYCTTSFKSKMRGKVFKTLMNTKSDIDTSSRYEAYPMDVEYLSENDANERYKERFDIPEIIIPNNAPPLENYIKKMIERCETNNN